MSRSGRPSTSVFQLCCSRWILCDIRLDAERFRQSSRLVAFILSMLIWVPVFSTIFAALNAPISSRIVQSAGVALIGVLALLRCGTSLAVCCNLFICAVWSTYSSLAVFNGGANAPSTMWYVSIPVLALWLSGFRTGVFWTSASLLFIAGLALLQACEIHCINELTPGGMKVLRFAALIGLVSCVFVLVSVFKKFEQTALRVVHEANQSLETKAATDSLTGLPNRRAFDQKLEEEWNRHARLGLPLSVVVIDVDFFKQFNDAHGHLLGDHCLKSVARTLRTSFSRAGDVVARYGGDEFTAVLPNTDEAGAVQITNAARCAIKALQIQHPCSLIGPDVTISIGVASVIPIVGQSASLLLLEADSALYRAKDTGRDKVGQIPTVLNGPDKPLLSSLVNDTISTGSIAVELNAL